MTTSCNAAIGKYLLRVAISLGLLALAPLASASVIYSQGHVTSAADILNIGTVVAANHLGGTSITPITINGVDFGISGSDLGGMVASGSSDFSNQFTSGSPLDQLFSGLWFQSGGTSSLTLNGLTAGTDYLLQLFLANNINSTGKASRVSLQSQSYNIQNFGNGADYLRITFTAAGTSQVVSFGTGSTNEDQRMVLNGYALETAAGVPEPATLMLLGAGLLGLGVVRRKRMS